MSGSAPNVWSNFSQRDYVKHFYQFPSISIVHKILVLLKIKDKFRDKFSDQAMKGDCFISREILAIWKTTVIKILEKRESSLSHRANPTPQGEVCFVWEHS